MRWRAPPPGIDGRGGARREPARRGSRVALALVVSALALPPGCARQEAPPGAEIDNTPPRLESIRPEDGAVVPGFDEPLTLRFDEPVDERRGLERQLVASPADRYRVDFGFSTVEIEPRDGWREGVVYFFRVPPSFSDVLGNRTEEPIEVTVSTGPPITDTRVEAHVHDRVTGDRLREARVLFYREDGDSVPYTAVRDTGEAHRLLALPPGRYRAWAFRDLNRNLRVEPRLEAHDSTWFELEGPDGAVTLDLRVVEPDSTPPVLASATARDSQLVELRFDDPLDPEQDFGRTEVAVRDTATGRTWPVAAVGLTPAGVGRRQRTRPDADAPREGAPAAGDTADALAGADVAAEADPDTVPGDPGGAAGADTLPPDTVDAPAGDTAVGGAVERARAADDGTDAVPDTAPLPSRTALVRLEEPLRDGDVYRVRAGAFANLHALRGGGDTLFVYSAPADTTEPAETPPADTAPSPDMVPVDTAPPPDTVPADTSGAGAVPADAGDAPGAGAPDRDAPPPDSAHVPSAAAARRSDP